MAKFGTVSLLSVMLLALSLPVTAARGATGGPATGGAGTSMGNATGLPANPAGGVTPGNATPLGNAAGLPPVNSPSFPTNSSNGSVYGTPNGAAPNGSSNATPMGNATGLPGAANENPAYNSNTEYNGPANLNGNPGPGFDNANPNVDNQGNTGSANPAAPPGIIPNTNSPGNGF